MVIHECPGLECAVARNGRDITHSSHPDDQVHVCETREGHLSIRGPIGSGAISVTIRYAARSSDRSTAFSDTLGNRHGKKGHRPALPRRGKQEWWEWWNR